MEAKVPVIDQSNLPGVVPQPGAEQPSQGSPQPAPRPEEFPLLAGPALVSAVSPAKAAPVEELKVKKMAAAEAEHFLDKDHSDLNMVVAIRVRPVSSKEISNGEFEILSIEDKLLIVHDPKELEGEGKHLDVLHRSKEQRFFFDRIFRDTSQEEVYQRSCAHLVRPILDGYNATVFAYGTTGSGKTYTMVGTQEEPGVMARTLRDMFAAMAQDTEREYELRVSYVEIYNEIIHDLLVHNSKDTYLELRDDPIKGVTIAGVTETKVEDSKHVMSLLLQGNRRRTTEATNANQTSSRSHAVFQITVSSKTRTKSTNVEVLCGKLSLIDLAGSERGSVTENRGIRLMEGAKINRSLLSLANCINALGDKSKKGFFVPYRDSKLTRMLKDSLGGNCRTVMIATISPANMQYEETVNTLKYASRAKVTWYDDARQNIKIKAIPNKKLVLMHISAYKHIISDLRDEIERLKARIKTDGSAPAKQTDTASAKVKCTCGRGDDEEAKKQMYNEVAQAYDDIMQLEQALIELDEQNTMNSIEIKKREAKILIFYNSMFEKQGKNIEVEDVNSINLDTVATDDAETKQAKEQVKRQQEKIGILKENTKKNIERRQLMKKELLESYELIRKIRQEIPSRLKHQDSRDYLELVIKNNFLEAQNVQLLLNLQLQARTISQLKSMIMRQQRYIQENHLDSGDSTWLYSSPGVDMKKIFAGKQFDEIEEGDEDYKRLLVASPISTIGKGEAKKEEEPLIPEPAPGPMQEFVGIIVGGDAESAAGNNPPEDLPASTDAPAAEVAMAEELSVEAKESTMKGVTATESERPSEASNAISVTGVSAFKIEGKSVGPSTAAAGEKKSAAVTKKSAKENKTKASGGPAAGQPASLSVMGSKIAAPKKGAPPGKGKGKA